MREVVAVGWLLLSYKAISSSAFFTTGSENKVAMYRGPALGAAKVSGLTPFFKWLRYESQRAKARFPR